MAFNVELADRTREIISLTHTDVEEKEMFGGLCFMVNDKMCLGIIKDRLMVRLDPAKYDEVLEKDGCEPMDFSGKPMKGYVFVDSYSLMTMLKLEYWVILALEFNEKAQKSKKRKS